MSRTCQRSKDRLIAADPKFRHKRIILLRGTDAAGAAHTSSNAQPDLDQLFGMIRDDFPGDAKVNVD
jgi:hypothetical protein